MLDHAPTITGYTVSIKALLPIALILALASCGDADQAPAPAPGAQPGANDQADAEAGKDDRKRYTAFESRKACEQAGRNPLQCDRAWGTADAMAKVDAPVYDTKQACQQAWRFCAQAQDGKSSPAMSAFAIAGRENGDQPPSADQPAFYVPAFVTYDGRLVYLTGERENPSLNEIDLKDFVRQAPDPAAQAASTGQ